jgi:hypothetical protein
MIKIRLLAVIKTQGEGATGLLWVMKGYTQQPAKLLLRVFEGQK